MEKIEVKLRKQRNRYILSMYGLELEYKFNEFNKKLVWRSYKWAKNFLMEHEFVHNGKVLNKDNIVIVKLKEDSDDL